VGVSWSASDIPDVKKYQVQYATSDTFIGATTVTVYGTRLTLPDLAAEQTYYVRAKAINSIGESSAWSATLNAEAGKASYSNLESGASSNIVTATKTQGFNPAQVDDGNSPARFLRTNINFPVAAETLIIGIAKGALVYATTATFYVSIKVDGQEVIEYENDNNVAGSNGTVSVPGLTVPVLLGAGEHLFEFDINIVDAADNTTYDPNQLSLSIWQVRK
jgi:hypothetical protein